MSDPCDGCMDGGCDLCEVFCNNGKLPTGKEDMPPITSSEKRQVQSLRDFFSKGGDPYDHC